MASIESGGVATRPNSGPDNERRIGIIAALTAYGTWGFFPILFRAIEAVNPFVVVAHRIVWSFFLVGGILWQRRRMQEVLDVLRHWPSARGIFISALLLSVNWLAFVWGVDHGHVLQVSFGYFINPLVSIAIGMIFLGERFNRLQWLALGVGLVAVGIQAYGLGQFPFISLTLALCFGFYGYVRKTIDVGSAPGLFIETLMLFPIALGYLVFMVWRDGMGAQADPLTFILLVATGPATSFALIVFAFANKRLPLSMMGMFQYVAPSLHFLLAIFLFGEAINPAQLTSFALIWLALVIYSFDSWHRGRVARRKRAAAQ